MANKTPNSNIVVGLDGSPGALPALKWALHQAEARSAELLAVYAWQVPALAYSAPGYIPPEKDSLETEGKRILSEALASLGPNAPVAKVSIAVVSGPAAEVLPAMAAEDGASLLVVGSRGHGKIAEVLLGSVSHSLMQKSKLPLAIVPQRAGGLGDGRIVVGVDGSVGSKGALRWALAEAATAGGTVEAVMVLPSPSPELPPHLPEALRLREEGEGPAARQLASVVDELTAQAPAVSGKVIETVLHGNPAHTLHEHAKGCDMLVVGRRGLGAIHEAFSGSVSSWCSHHADRPVVVVPS